MTARRDELPFKIVEVLGPNDEMLGTAANIVLARALFDRARMMYPTKVLELRNRAQVVQSHP
jgi:hypothetical protein